MAKLCFVEGTAQPPEGTDGEPAAPGDEGIPQSNTDPGKFTLIEKKSALFYLPFRARGTVEIFHRMFLSAPEDKHE